jgi:hypothetical protein
MSGYTDTEEACIQSLTRDYMDAPDMDGIVSLMGPSTVEFAGLLWDGKADEARDMLYRYGRLWAERMAEREMSK